MNLALNDFTESLFSSLMAEGIEYAILRNYSQFPDFDHDIDLVLSSKDLQNFRKILVSVAGRSEWEYLTECFHWSKSKARHQNIEIFRLYDSEPMVSMQIDIFHGFLLWSLPLFNEGGLLAERVLDSTGRFFHLNADVENLFRLLQVNSLLSSEAEPIKAVKYISRILDHANEVDGRFLDLIGQHFGPAGRTALLSLMSNDVRGFRRSMWHAKLFYLNRIVLSQPSVFFKSIVERLKDLVRLFWTEPCGQVLWVHKDTENAEQLDSCMASLANAKVISKWTMQGASRPTLSWPERRVLERGGLVIKWAERRECDVELAATDPSRLIFERVVQRHQSIPLRRQLPD